MSAKVFEIGDVLPATTQLRISWLGTSFNGMPYWANLATGALEFASSSNAHFISYTGDVFMGPATYYIGGIYVTSSYEGSSYYDTIETDYVDIDTSAWTLEQRTIMYYQTMDEDIYWEDLNPAPAGYTNMSDFYLDVANSIRNKKGTTSSIKPVNFAEEISTILTVVELTQAQYDALSTYDNNTYYLIVEDE